MKLLHVVAFLAAFPAGALAQPMSDDGRGSTGPGAAQDGSRPNEGAITGGTTGGARRPPPKGVRRCMELTGSLREQCLLQEEGASTGGTLPDPAGGKAVPPPVAPPPQNPR